MVLHKTGTLGRSRRPGSIPGSGVFFNRTLDAGVLVGHRTNASELNVSKDFISAADSWRGRKT